MILCLGILNISCENIADIVECNNIDIDQEKLDKMTIKEQEEYVSQLI